MEPEFSAAQSVVIALVATLALVGLHLAAPRIRRLPLVPEAATGSFAGGLAVAYVFLHLLPEVAEGNEAIGEALHDVVEPTPLLDLGIFFVALVGFVAFFALQRLADRAGAHREAVFARASSPHRTAPGPERRGDTSATGGGDAAVYWLHLASFMIYNALITYTMPLRVRTGLAFAVLFTVAMGLHFVLTDRELDERYPRRFGRQGRLLLAAALVAGWAIAAAVAPTSALLVALLTALLAGSILLNVFKEEIPSGRRSSFVWFLTGLAVYATLLTVITALSE
jgi:hypothetical protein